MNRAKWAMLAMADLDFAGGPRLRRRVRDWLGRLLDATEMEEPPPGMTIVTNVIPCGGAAVQFDYDGRTVSVVVARPGLLQLGWMRASSRKYGTMAFTSDHAGHLKNTLWWLIDGQAKGQPKFNSDEECYGRHKE